MRKEIIDLMTTEEREVLLESIRSSVTLYHCLRNYEIDMAYNILEDGNLEDEDEEEKVVLAKIDRLEKVVKTFLSLTL
jgi:hypothetical protein